jgi:putative ABC transport system ATP-binding protein
MSIPAFTLSADEQVLLAGPSGCGKSTLLLLAAGLLDAESGEIELAGRSIANARGGRRDAIRADRVGMVFQTHHLLPGFTARENVSVPLLFGGVRPAEHAAIADPLLDRLGISDPLVRVDRLSVGQQQRVAIARALVGGPAVVFADEPTAALDPENAANAVSLLKDICRERNAALLLTSHDPGLESAFSRVVRFEELAQTSEAVG